MSPIPRVGPPIALARRSMPVNRQTGTAYTLSASDVGTLVSINNAAPVTVTLPPSTDTGLTLGDVITINQGGAGKVTFAGGGGSFVVQEASFAAMSRGQHAVVQAILTATDFFGSSHVWLLVGGLDTA